MNCLQGNTKSSTPWIARSKGRIAGLTASTSKTGTDGVFSMCRGSGRRRPPLWRRISVTARVTAGAGNAAGLGASKKHNNGKLGNRYIRTLRISGAPAFFAAEIGAVRFQQRILTGGRLRQPAF